MPLPFLRPHMPWGVARPLSDGIAAHVPCGSTRLPRAAHAHDMMRDSPTNSILGWLVRSSPKAWEPVHFVFSGTGAGHLGIEVGRRVSHGAVAPTINMSVLVCVLRVKLHTVCVIRQRLDDFKFCSSILGKKINPIHSFSGLVWKHRAD